MKCRACGTQHSILKWYYVCLKNVHVAVPFGEPSVVFRGFKRCLLSTTSWKHRPLCNHKAVCDKAHFNASEKTEFTLPLFTGTSTHLNSIAVSF